MASALPVKAGIFAASGPIVRRYGASLLQIAAFLLVVAFVGAGIAIGALYFAAPVMALIVAFPLLLLPLEWVIGLLMVITFLVSGPLQYFAHFIKAFWIPYLFGLLLYFRIPLEFFRFRERERRGSGVTAAPSIWFIWFIAVVAMGSVVNMPPVLQVVIASKEYFFLWSVLILLASGFASPRFLDRSWRALLWLVPLQFPVILYQRFVVAANRRDYASFDAVTGLFGGLQETGGGTGGMGMFLLFCLLLAIALWRVGKLRTAALAGIAITSLVSILLAEVKIAILLLPVGVALLYRRELFRRPLRSMIVIAVTVAFAAGLAVAYNYQFGSQYNAYKGPFGYIERAIDVNVDADFYNPITGEIGRIASLKYWRKRHSLDDPLRFFFGHGMGASRYGTVMGEQASKNLQYRIDRSTAAIYLWEAGVLGLLAFAGFLLSAAKLAARLSRDTRLDDPERAVLSAIAPILLLQVPVLVYDIQASAMPQMQLLLMLMVGQVLFSARRCAVFKAKSDAEAHAAQPQIRTPAWSPAAANPR